MQSASSRIWTRVVVSISYDDNHYNTGTSTGINTVPQPPYSPNLGPCDFWLFPKFTSCRYETIEKYDQKKFTEINVDDSAMRNRL